MSTATRTVEVAGLRLRTAVHGHGPPLLLITGLGANIEMWAPFERLIEKRTVITYDAPGIGRSQTPSRPRRMTGLADVAAELLQALGHERADVLGYSLGGGVAQELARRRPEMVDRLILCATSPGVGSIPPVNPVVPAVLATPYRYYAPGHYRRVAPLVAGGRTARDPEVLDRQIQARRASPPSWTGYAHQLFAAWGWSSLPWLHRIRQPTLVLTGDDDPIMPVFNARILAWRIPNAQLHVLPGAGHLFLVDEPERAVGPIHRFLTAA
jgi:poly(3-hydroxyoctanoate) depolymerase